MNASGSKRKGRRPHEKNRLFSKVIILFFATKKLYQVKGTLRYKLSLVLSKPSLSKRKCTGVLKVHVRIKLSPVNEELFLLE